MREIYQNLSLMTKVRTYSELSRLETFEERYDYLRLRGVVGESTFGFDRILNQRFYRSSEWKRLRSFVITRDNGCDLGVLGYEIYANLLIHHMNPMSLDDIKHGGDLPLNPEFLITTTLQTHNAIHYGDENLLPRGPRERKAGDTTLW
jgi:hypothetical protein